MKTIVVVDYSGYIITTIIAQWPLTAGFSIALGIDIMHGSVLLSDVTHISI